MINLDVNLIATILSFVVGIIASTWTLAWKFSREFEGIRAFVTDQVKQILEKLEYHERHDDQRFATISDSIWELRLQNAIRNGLAQEKDHNKPRAARTQETVRE